VLRAARLQSEVAGSGPGAAGIAATVDGLLSSVAAGRLRSRPFAIRWWDGSESPAAVPAPVATVVVRDPAALAYVLREPSEVGLGRAWISGALDLEGDLEAMLALRHQFGGLPFSTTDRLRAAALALRLAGRAVLRRPPRPAPEAALSGRRHTLRRDQAAIRHHYDVPDEFYRLLLGTTMVYSCAYFEDPCESLEQAQTRKLELVCRKLRLHRRDRLLDVGCGWGSLLIHAARHHGVRAVGVTLSPAQAESARRRIRAAGLGDWCEVRVADYREVHDGPYDAVASVGMYEHVGRRGLDGYVGAVRRVLRPGGLFLNHGIARLSANAPTRTFNSAFVFPDGELHPPTAFFGALEDAGFELRDVESLREHYPLTLRRWLANLEAQRDAAVAAAGSERERAWRLYIAGAASAFAHGELSVFQTLAVRAGAPHRGVPAIGRIGFY
jgi:cyclopropane-fatty-acyl-phospholipid synthase